MGGSRRAGMVTGRTGRRAREAGSPRAPAVLSARHAHTLRARRKRNLKAYLFVSPALLLFLAFIAIPVAGIVVFSFFQWDLLTPPKFTGLSNFRMLAHDPQLGQALFNSLLFDVMTTSLHIIVGMGLAIAVTSVSSRVVRYWARTAFVVPFLMSAGAVAVMWSYILSGSTGPLNYYLEKLGTSPPDWLASGTWALPSLVGVDLWQTVGITFIIFLVGLQTIPTVLYEAADIDGVGPFQRFRYVTSPYVVTGDPGGVDHRVHRRIRDLHLALRDHQWGAGKCHPHDNGLHLPGCLQEPRARVRSRHFHRQPGRPGNPRPHLFRLRPALGAL